MNTAIFEAYRRQLAKFPPEGKVLEIGAKPNPNASLLALLPNCTRSAINLRVPPDTSAMPGVRFIEGNANDLREWFPDASVDAVICSAVLEHDPAFWKTTAEVRRVVRPGGLFFVGVPGFPRSVDRVGRAANWLFAKLKNSSIPGGSKIAASRAVGRAMAARTYPFHAAPNDYYRFSEEAVKRVFLEGYEVVDLQYVLDPVRILAVGRRN